MKLNKLIQGLPNTSIINPNGELEIQSLSYHSKQTKPGSLFTAIRGFKHDGHTFLQEAISNGAVAIAGEDLPSLQALQSQAAVILTSNSRSFLAHASARFYHYPSKELKFVGITGTNGKTTTCYLVEAIFRAAGLVSGMITTVETSLAGQAMPSVRTTPEAPDLQNILRRMVEAGVTHAVIELSSHGIALERPLGCHFDIVALTNISQDHLDFHSSFQDYIHTKARLFTEYVENSEKCVRGVVGADDTASEMIKEVASCPILTCGISSEADLRVAAVSRLNYGTSLHITSPEGTVELTYPLYGSFNVQNVLLAAGIARLLEIPWSAISRGLLEAKIPAGRLERIDEGQPYLIFVDYAHTPDSLRLLLQTAREFCSGRLILVFGCGGDRDRGKRPLMGQIAESGADICVVTSDNPRSENPEDIIEGILAGMSSKPASVESDRGKAIGLALSEAKEGDVVLLAGKGHETCQIFKDRTIHFSDHETARQWLRNHGYQREK